MKKWKILLFFILMFALIFTPIITQSIGESYAENVNRVEVSNHVDREKDYKEVKELRSANSKTFLKPDGKSYVLEQYIEPVHFKKNGKWIEIDNNLKRVKTKSNNKLNKSFKNKNSDSIKTAFKNKANQFQVNFAESTDVQSIVSFGYKDVEIDFQLVDGKKVFAELDRNKVTYPNIYPNTDLVYHVSNTGLKEEWVLHEYNGKNIYSMKLDLQSATPLEGEDGSIKIKDKHSKDIIVLPKPLMVDSNDSASYDINMELRTDGGNTYLDLVADAKWLSDPERKFPIRIDPTVELQDISTTYDTFIGNKNKDTNYQPFSYLITGNIDDYGVTRTFIEFELPKFPDGTIVNRARLSLNQYKTEEMEQVDLFPVTSSWYSGTLTWNNQPSVGNRTASSYVSGPGEYSWDMTDIVKNWIKGDVENNGISLRHHNESNNRKSYRSSDYVIDETKRPKLEIEYKVIPEEEKLSGTDPLNKGCTKDAIIANRSNIYNDDTNKKMGELQLRYSPKCKTAWGRVVPVNNTDAGTLIVKVVRNDGEYLEAMANPTFSTLWTFQINDQDYTSYAEAAFYDYDGKKIGSAKTSSY
ncbi:DNRLRE domain-containing protein [Mechercharimyces sp. CAU 1602]|uniref:DNRLRE domain-containing protein n=1 Tax=Mechercharimyces sp. CAU 1602 TaxID=2973933 RepID=UPI002162A0E4|nr:DNRLRE domain-containing protein [Mechercharimyces sp. CAU 1602]MCS1350126.1 DNRLRE domain-containing protein [Mechercharimyces sp. CAU 1602]